MAQGNQHWYRKEYGDALAAYDKAVELDPTMSSMAVEEGLYRALWEDEVFKQIVEDAALQKGQSAGGYPRAYTRALTDIGAKHPPAGRRVQLLGDPATIDNHGMTGHKRCRV